MNLWRTEAKRSWQLNHILVMLFTGILCSKKLKQTF